jgi:hypothetical protein
MRLPFYADETVEASADELRSEPLFCNRTGLWIEDCDPRVDKPEYTGADACPKCGKGTRELARPLTGAFRKFRKRHLLHYPPAILIASTSFARVIERRGWTGVRPRPVLERATQKESKDVCQLEITSILPAMHPSAPIERTCIPDFCPVCRKLGYRLRGWQPVYSRSVLESAADFNFSSEWLAEHYVSCPELICSREVVTYLLQVESRQQWIPLLWLNDDGSDA